MENPQKSTTTKPKVVFIITLLAVALFAYYKFAYNPILDNIKNQITKQFKDPSSTKYRKIRVNRSEGKEYYCGEYNSKNSYGAFVGYNRFIAEKKDKPLIVFTEGNWDSDEFKFFWSEYCN